MSTGARVTENNTRGEQKTSLRPAGRSLNQRLVQRLPKWAWLALAPLVIWGATTVNPLITVFSLLLLPVFALLLWREGNPPVLLFACVMQWLQAASGIFYHNRYEENLSQAIGSPELARATWLSLIGVLAQALGMRAALIGAGRLDTRNLEGEARQLSPARIFLVYLACLFAFTFVKAEAFRLPGLTQPLLGIATLQWVPVVLLAEAVLTKHKGYALLAIVIAIEFFTGLLGYFSNFKSVFLILIVVLLTSSGRLRKGRWFALAAISTFLLVTSSAWTAIKGEYREFLNKGTSEQAIYEPVSARAEKLIDLVQNLDLEQIGDSFEQSILRLSYVDLFAECIDHVPSAVPYEKGALWLGAIQHSFMPRLFFPDKPITDDSARTQKYTGRDVAGHEQGTSIGIGYMAESYIDFGPYLMVFPIFLLGVFFGLIFRFFIFSRKYRLLGMASAISILVFGAYNIETSNIKLVGGNATAAIALGLFYWLGSSRFLNFMKSRASGP